MVYFKILLSVILFAAFAVLAYSGSKMFVKDSYVLNNEEKKTVSKIYYGAEVKNSRLYGWYKDGVLYDSPSMEMNYAEIYDEKILEYTGKLAEGLKEAYIDAEVSGNNLASDLKKVLDIHELKYFELCSTCHSAVDYHRFDLTRWNGILNSMKDHAGMENDDLQDVYRIIKYKLKD
jgi:hypothetical protein